MLVERVHGWPADVGSIAALASVVADAAAQDDPAAQAIVRDAYDSLREQVAHVAKVVRTQDALPVVICGGAFEAIPALRAAVEEGCIRTGPCTLGQAVVEPAHGAALLALAALGVIRPAR
jgi:N-acetylglucosamine kinase-like BadF-type ATPase